jgi:glucose-6-phosphate dehydrogenase assembly protein OpcA
MAGFRHIVWTAQGTTPAEIETALRKMLVEGASGPAGYAPARALNMVCVVDKALAEETAVRLRGAGRYLASRTVMCAVEPGRDRIDATAEISSDATGAGELALLRETVTLELGEQYLSRLEPIVDPLVVTDLPTVLWSPHGYDDAVRALLPLSQVVLVDSMEEDVGGALHRARKLLEDAYVVDLAWLRSTPWRERVAATFDPPNLRPDLHAISGVTIRHHPSSAAAGMLLVGWLASRLEWKLGPLRKSNGGLAGSAGTESGELQIGLQPMSSQEVPGLAGLTIETATGRCFALDRGPGGLRAHYRNAKGDERAWTVLGASRGETGILGEGIRQALLRDATYGPALTAANRLVD